MSKEYLSTCCQQKVYLHSFFFMVEASWTLGLDCPFPPALRAAQPEGRKGTVLHRKELSLRSSAWTILLEETLGESCHVLPT